MSRDYQKINTLFKRDEDGVIIPEELTCPEFEYLKDCKWECTEKIDGTNIHCDIFSDGTDYRIDICGRTEKAVIPSHLMAHLLKPFSRTAILQVFSEQLANATPEAPFQASIYGEGYGQKIQKCGKDYISNDVGFILFDIRVGRWWLSREACEEIAGKLGVSIVPLVGYMTLKEAIHYVDKGFKSSVAENADLQAEGLVLKTPNGLLDRSGLRIITKLKTCDFEKYRRKHKTLFLPI